MRFTEVGGLSVELATEEVAEGGENRFVQKYPGARSIRDLVLKRGLLMQLRDLRTGSASASRIYDIEPQDVDVKLLNEEHEPLMTWHIVDAYPDQVVGQRSQRHRATRSSIETLQLSYQSLHGSTGS